jgi:hypothetical protein
MNPFEIYPKSYIKEDNTDLEIPELSNLIKNYPSMTQQDQAMVANCLSFAMGRVRCLSLYFNKDRLGTWESYKPLVKENY